VDISSRGPLASIAPSPTADLPHLLSFYRLSTANPHSPIGLLHTKPTANTQPATTLTDLNLPDIPSSSWRAGTAVYNKSGDKCFVITDENWTQQRSSTATILYQVTIASSAPHQVTKTRSHAMTIKGHVDRSMYSAGGTIALSQDDKLLVTTGVSGGAARLYDAETLTPLASYGEDIRIDGTPLEYSGAYFLTKPHNNTTYILLVPSWWRGEAVSGIESYFDVLSVHQVDNSFVDGSALSSSQQQQQAILADTKLPTFTIKIPTGDNNRRGVRAIAATTSYLPSSLMTIAMASVDGTVQVLRDGGSSNWPGPMYPPGYVIKEENYDYLEAEDELDIVISSAPATNQDKSDTDAGPQRGALGGKASSDPEDVFVDVVTSVDASASQNVNRPYIPVVPELEIAVALRMADAGISVGQNGSSKAAHTGAETSDDWFLNSLPPPSTTDTTTTARHNTNQLSAAGVHAQKGDPHPAIIAFMGSKLANFASVPAPKLDSTFDKCAACAGVSGVPHRCGNRPLPSTIDRAPPLGSVALALQTFAQGRTYGPPDRAARISPEQQPTSGPSQVTSDGVALSSGLQEHLKEKKRKARLDETSAKCLTTVKKDKRDGWRVTHSVGSSTCDHEDVGPGEGIVLRTYSLPPAVAMNTVDFGGKVVACKCSELFCVPKGNPPAKKSKTTKSKQNSPVPNGGGPAPVSSFDSTSVAAPNSRAHVQLAPPPPPAVPETTFVPSPYVPTSTPPALPPLWGPIEFFQWHPQSSILNVAFKPGTDKIGLTLTNDGAFVIAMASMNPDSPLTQCIPKLRTGTFVKSFNTIDLVDTSQFVHYMSRAKEKREAFSLQFFFGSRESRQELRLQEQQLRQQEEQMKQQQANDLLGFAQVAISPPKAETGPATTSAESGAAAHSSSADGMTDSTTENGAVDSSTDDTSALTTN
jgi:hypothetical protein